MLTDRSVKEPNDFGPCVMGLRSGKGPVLAWLSDFAKQKEDQQDYYNQAKAAAPVVSSPIEWTAADTAEAAKQSDHQDNQDNGSN
jgi:hypothetical protein